MRECPRGASGENHFQVMVYVITGSISYPCIHFQCLWCFVQIYQDFCADYLVHMTIEIRYLVRWPIAQSAVEETLHFATVKLHNWKCYCKMTHEIIKLIISGSFHLLFCVLPVCEQSQVQMSCAGWWCCTVASSTSTTLALRPPTSSPITCPTAKFRSSKEKRSLSHSGSLTGVFSWTCVPSMGILGCLFNVSSAVLAKNPYVYIMFV